MNAISTVFAAVVLAAMVTYGSCQTSIKCYTCTGTWTEAKNGFDNCDYPFNTTQMMTVTCPGVCTKAVTFDATHNTGASYGTYDTVIRGCTITSPKTGCFAHSGDGAANPHQSVCISTCSTDLCNSADGLRSTTFALVGLVSMMAVAFCR